MGGPGIEDIEFDLQVGLAMTRRGHSVRVREGEQPGLGVRVTEGSRR
jgi:hypothetical protein